MLLVATLGTAAPLRAESKRPTRERVIVEEVFATPEGQYVVILRTQAEPHLYIPIAIGEMEALALRMRIDRRAPPRPLTLNLLESVMHAGKMRVTEISIDDHKGGIFLGRVRVKQGGKMWDIDARPSDALGLAIGKEIPIWVTSKVLESAAIDPSELEDEKPVEEGAGFEESL
jgi:bifunctional DNase/RNase